MNIFDLNKTIVIAEIGNNHEGSFSVAKKLIKKAKECGADAVKFQTFIPDLYVSVKEKKRIKRLKKFYFSFNQFKQLSLFAKSNKIEFLSTPFDLRSADFLNSIQSIFKISSSDSNFYPLLRKVANFNKSIILSTGMTDMEDIIKSKNLIFNIWKKNKKNKKKLILMHCVSSYPTENKYANLSAIETMKKKFKNCIIGYSDHTIGINAALTATALGAKIIEKHFTLDKKFSSFRDHQLSSDPKEMKTLVANIRNLEESTGDGIKRILNNEKKDINYMRRSAVAAKDISKGKKIAPNDIKWIRIKNGLKINFEKILFKKRTKKLIKENQLILKKDLTNF